MCCEIKERQLALSVFALKRSEIPNIQITLSVSIIDIKVCSQTSYKKNKFSDDENCKICSNLPSNCQQNIDLQVASIHRVIRVQHFYQLVLHKGKEEIDEISQVMYHKL